MFQNLLSNAGTQIHCFSSATKRSHHQHLVDYVFDYIILTGAWLTLIEKIDLFSCATCLCALLGQWKLIAWFPLPPAYNWGTPLHFFIIIVPFLPTWSIATYLKFCKCYEFHECKKRGVMALVSSVLIQGPCHCFVPWTVFLADPRASFEDLFKTITCGGISIRVWLHHLMNPWKQHLWWLTSNGLSPRQFLNGKEIGIEWSNFIGLIGKPSPMQTSFTVILSTKFFA